MPSRAFALKNNSAALVLQALSSQMSESDAQRIHLANRLHRDVAGSLVACTSLCEMIRHDLEQADGAAHQQDLLSSLDSALRQALQVVRELTEHQFPPVLKAFGLNVALQQLVRSLGENFVGSLVLHISGDEPQIEIARRLNLFHLLEALLKHCIRHVNTTWVEIACRFSPEKLEFSIEHEGDGSLWKDSVAAAELAAVEAWSMLVGSPLQIMPSKVGERTRVSFTVSAPFAQPHV